MGIKRTTKCFGVWVLGLGACIALGLLSAPLPCEANKIFRDKNGYYTFSPPPGWIQKGFSKGKRSKVKFTSPDGKASIRMNVRLARSSEKIWKNLLNDKKAAKKILEKEFPQAKVSLSETTLGGIRCIKIVTVIHGSHMQENYVYVKDGLHFNLSYAAKRQQDFARHKQAALASFETIRSGKRGKEARLEGVRGEEAPGSLRVSRCKI